MLFLTNGVRIANRLNGDENWIYASFNRDLNTWIFFFIERRREKGNELQLATISFAEGDFSSTASHYWKRSGFSISHPNRIRHKSKVRFSLSQHFFFFHLCESFCVVVGRYKKGSSTRHSICSCNLWCVMTWIILLFFSFVRSRSIKARPQNTCSIVVLFVCNTHCWRTNDFYLCTYTVKNRNLIVSTKKLIARIFDFGFGMREGKIIWKKNSNKIIGSFVSRSS